MPDDAAVCNTACYTLQPDLLMGLCSCTGRRCAIPVASEYMSHQKCMSRHHLSSMHGEVASQFVCRAVLLFFPPLCQTHVCATPPLLLHLSLSCWSLIASGGCRIGPDAMCFPSISVSPPPPPRPPMSRPPRPPARPAGSTGQQDTGPQGHGPQATGPQGGADG